MTTYRCQACLDPCTPVRVDTGIGSYEYWGQRGIDSKFETLSDCCHAYVEETCEPEEPENELE